MRSAAEECDRGVSGYGQASEYGGATFDFPKDFNRLGQNTYILKRRR
jgi:hypothetical protein